MATIWWLEYWYNRLIGNLLKREWDAERYDVNEMIELAFYDYLIAQKRGGRI